MQTFKAKDLYIVRPLKLVKAKRYKKISFPYNLLMKLGLIPEDEFSSFCEENPLKRKFARLLPKHFYDSFLSCSKSTYHFSKDDTAIATLDLINGQFCNVLTGERYDSYVLRHRLNYSEPTELVVSGKILSKKDLALHLYYEELKQYWEDKKNNVAATEPRREDFNEKELTLDELREIRSILVSREYDRLFTVKTESSKRFVKPFYNSSVSFDAKGNEIMPINKFKVKEKKIRR